MLKKDLLKKIIDCLESDIINFVAIWFRRVLKSDI